MITSFIIHDREDLGAIASRAGIMHTIGAQRSTRADMSRV